MKKDRTARELLLGYLENINDPDKAIELFADDAVIKLPHLNSLGMPWQWKGKSMLYEFLRNTGSISRLCISRYQHTYRYA